LTRDLFVLNINSDIKNIRLVRRMLKIFLGFQGINEDEIFKIELAVNEALANIIEHTYKFDSTKRIIICFSIAGDEIHITFRDFGEKVDPSKIKVKIPPEVLSENGRGIYIIKSMVDEFKFDDKVAKGNLLHLKKIFSSQRESSRQ